MYLCFSALVSFLWAEGGGGRGCTFDVFRWLVTLINPVSEIGFCIPYQTEEFYCILFVYQQ